MKKKIRLNITVEDIAFLVMWAAFFLPPSLDRASALLAHGITLLGYGAFLLMLLKRRNDFPVKEDVMFIFAFLFYCMIIVILKTPGEFPVYARRYLLPAFESVFLIRWTFGGNRRGFTYLYHVSAFYIVANFLSVLLFHDGMFKSAMGSSVERPQWLYGSKNNIPLYMILLITIAAYYYYSMSRTKLFYLLVLMGAFSIMMSGETGFEFMGGSSTGLVGYFFVLALIAYYMYARRTNRPALGVKWIFALILILNLILLTGLTLPGMNELIVNVFHKSVTFTGRTRIWATNLEAVGEHLLFGRGEEGVLAHVKLQKEWVNTDYTYNFAVKLLVNYGIIGLGMFIAMILKIEREKDTGDRILFAGFFGVLIIGLMNEIELHWLLLFPLMLTMHSHALPVTMHPRMRRLKPERSLGLQIKF